MKKSLGEGECMMGKKLGIVIRECVEPGAESIGQHNVKLDDAKYEEAMRAFPVMCADILPIDRERRVVFLAPRAARPKRGWWTIGGRIMRGEPIVSAAIRKLKQEVGLEIAADRLDLIAFNRYISVDREQFPREAGADTPAFVFAFEPTPEEIGLMSRSLDKKEYEGMLSMRAFTREELIAHNVDPALIQLHDDLFG